MLSNTLFLEIKISRYLLFWIVWVLRLLWVHKLLGVVGLLGIHHVWIVVLGLVHHRLLVLTYRHLLILASHHSFEHFEVIFLEELHCLHLLWVMTFVLVHHAFFLSTRLLYCRSLHCLLGWYFDRLLAGNCDYFVCTLLSGWTGFGGFDTHWTPEAPLMIIAARSLSAHNSVGGIEPINTAPVM